MTSKKARQSRAQAAPAPPEPVALAHAAPALALLDRDRSLLAFNERVMAMVTREDVPLLERLRYLCIVSSNLDEFFEVRMAPHLSALRAGGGTGQVFEPLSAVAHALVARQYAIYNEVLIPQFRRHGIEIVAHGERNTEQRSWVQSYFRREVRPLLVPVSLDPSHPFPMVANKSLNFIVRLQGKDAFGRHNEVAIVKVPRVLPRIIALPERLGRKRRLFVSLSSVIRAHLHELFPGREVLQFSQFRVTRNSDLAVQEADVADLRTALRAGLEHRQFGEAVRLEVSSGCSQFLADFLLQQFELTESSLYRVHGPVNLNRLTQLIDLIADPSLMWPPYEAAYPRQLQLGQDVFERLKQGDVCIHQPFERFDGVLDFLRQAVADPQVMAIRQTIYRTGADSEMMQLLREAVRAGKEVMVVVELKARFDEEANINWAEMLESIGAQVVYGVLGLKTHAKMLLVTRREGRAIKRYAHLSTGNYNPRTARLYTDVSYLTADPVLTQDVEHVFYHLASQSRLPKLNRLLVAPHELHRTLVQKIEAVAQAAAQGAQARIVAKMNALTDEGLIRALVAAGRRGVEIDLIVRGACMLPAQVPGLTDHIRVRSIIGRFLEHSRVFYFHDGQDESLYLSSADWMNRNMFGRIELAWPVTDPGIRQRLIDECLVAYLHDTRDAWQLLPDASYLNVKPPSRQRRLGAQSALMAKYSAVRAKRA
jgi:polyphosphate kinase